MVELGLPDFRPVQQNMSFNAEAGVTRGLHAEPWDKLISLAKGRIFGAWVDLRPGESFGRSFNLEMGPEKAVFVPRGVANGYQALESDTAYSYLVNEHWSPQARSSYTYLNLADETVVAHWPIPLAQAIVSDADLRHPHLADVVAMEPRRSVIVGAGGQLGRALQNLFPDAVALSRADLDITDGDAVRSFDWQKVGTLINAAAWTTVDAAESLEGRRGAWAANVDAVRHLVDAAARNRMTFVQVSSDYVFDGAGRTGIEDAQLGDGSHSGRHKHGLANEHTEDEPFSPLGVYGATKAAGDALVMTLPDYYIVRTSWVVGDGKNFVRTMASLAAEGVSPKVVDDQFGRLTFASDLAAGIAHLLAVRPAAGTYNLTNDGSIKSWFEIAQEVFALVGRDPEDVSPQSTAEFAKGKIVAPRPVHSALRLDKIKSVGFGPRDASEALREYLESR